MKICSNLGYSIHLAYLWRGWGVNALARGAYDEYSAWRAVCVVMCVCVGVFVCAWVPFVRRGCLVGSDAFGAFLHIAPIGCRIFLTKKSRLDL